MSKIKAGTTSTTAYQVEADTTGTLVLQTGATPTTAVTIDTSQNVGIGASTLNDKFNLYSATSVYQRFQNSTTGTGATDGFQIGNDASAAYIWNYEAVPTIFATSNTERMRIDTSGNLLVGASSLISAERLGVTQTSASGQCAYYYNSNASFANYMQLMNTARAASSAFNFVGFYAAGAAKFSVDGNGSITAPTTHSLQRGGNELNLNYGMVAAGDIYWNYLAGATTGTHRFMNGNAGYAPMVASSFTPSSDYRVKTDVQDEPNALEKVLALRPVNYIKDDAPAREHGLIAHEVAELFPDLVGGEGKDAVDDEGDMVIQTVNYMGLTSILVKAIQELKAELDAAKADIATLKGAA